MWVHRAVDPTLNATLVGADRVLQCGLSWDCSAIWWVHGKHPEPGPLYLPLVSSKSACVTLLVDLCYLYLPLCIYTALCSPLYVVAIE